MPFVYEINGQRVEFDREPTDADIDEAAKNLGQPQQGITQMLTPPPEPSVNAAVAAAGAVRPAAEAYWQGPAKGGVRDAASMANILKQATPEALSELARNPMELAKAYVQGHPWYNAAKNIGSIPARAVGFAGQTAGGMLTAPENLALAPYNLAAYEQEKIRANPQAPGLEYNPYAQQVRGEYPTQGAAAAANRQRAIAGQQYGGVTPEERAILDQDRLNMAIRLKAAKKVLGQP